MRPRTLALLAGLAVVAAACGSTEIRVSSPPAEELGFIPQVADPLGDAGAGISVAADADGNPHLAYLAFERPAAEGEPPEVVLGAPELPAVMHAHLVGGAWTRTAVLEAADVSPDDETAIAVDADGVHHVAWTEGDRVAYSSNADGAFSEPEVVARGTVRGLSIAVDAQGTPWVAFYEERAGAEGPAALVRAATRVGGEWLVQTAAEADPRDPATTGVGVAGSEVLVAYGSGRQTLLARFTAGGWESEVADPTGGLGVSLALDGSGAPHLAYYSPRGEVRHALSAAPGRWETEAVADVEGAPAEEWSTAIALGRDGVRHIAWQQANGLAAASGEGGSLTAAGVPGSAAGTRPRLAAGADGDVFLAWYDTQLLRAMLSLRTAEEPLLAAPPAETVAPPPPAMETGGPPPCEPSGTELAISASPGAAVNGFDDDCLAAPAGQAFTIEFTNDDQGVPHNVAIYRDETAAESFFVGEIFPGPEVMTYSVDALEAGTFFFRCDVHPTTMTGTFVVQ